MNAIAAIGLSNEIGKDNQLLFHIKEDMKRFRQMTENKVVVMGRSTQESLPGGKPLKNRVNIVLSRNMHYNPDGFIVVHNTEELFNMISEYDTNDVFIIGGEKIYALLLAYCDNLYITTIYKRCLDADKFFPIIRKDIWKLVNFDYCGKDEKTGLEYSFSDYVNTAK